MTQYFILVFKQIVDFLMRLRIFMRKNFRKTKTDFLKANQNVILHRLQKCLMSHKPFSKAFYVELVCQSTNNLDKSVNEIGIEPCTLF